MATVVNHLVSNRAYFLHKTKVPCMFKFCYKYEGFCFKPCRYTYYFIIVQVISQIFLNKNTTWKWEILGIGKPNAYSTDGHCSKSNYVIMQF